MRTTGEFTTHTFVIPFDEYGQTITLYPFGDVHKFAPLHAKEHWDEFNNKATLEENAYFLGMGDYFDLGSTSERQILRDAKLHDSTIATLENIYEYQVEEFAKDIAHMRGRLIGLLGGNHFGQFESGITTDQKLAEKLGCKYLGVNAFIRLQFKQRNSKHGTNMALDIYAHHGRGGGRTIGASLNPVQQMAWSATADIYLMGDNHAKAVCHTRPMRLQSGGGRLAVSKRTVAFARTGSFLEGYVDGKRSYVAEAAYTPADLGCVEIRLTPMRTRAGGIDDAWIDIHAGL